jgi:hypothetical protein
LIGDDWNDHRRRVCRGRLKVRNGYRFPNRLRGTGRKAERSFELNRAFGEPAAVWAADDHPNADGLRRQVRQGLREFFRRQVQ